MPRRVVTAEGREYSVSPDLEVPTRGRLWALVRARVLDEITGAPPAAPVAIVPEWGGGLPRRTVTPRAVSSIVGLVGVPQEVFPDLDHQPYDLAATVRVPGYLDYPLRATVPAQPPPPVPPPPPPPLPLAARRTFTPIDAGDLGLHREPVVLRGRTVRTTIAATDAEPNCDVRLTRVWWTLSAASFAGPGVRPRLVSLRPTLSTPRYAPGGPVTSVLRRREMDPTPGEEKRLATPLRAGEDRLVLSDGVNLAPGDVLLVDAQDPDAAEYLAVASVAGGGTPQDQAAVTAVFPARRDHGAGALVQPTTPSTAPGATGADNVLERDAIPGDSCVFLQTMTDLGAATVVEIRDVGFPPAGSAPELHLVSRFETASDADGYFRLPALSRVAQVRVRARSGAQRVRQLVSPGYGDHEHRVELVFS